MHAIHMYVAAYGIVSFLSGCGIIVVVTTNTLDVCVISTYLNVPLTVVQKSGYTYMHT